MSCSHAFYVFIATILVLGTSAGGAELTIDFDRRTQKAVVRGVVDGRALDAGVARATLQYRRSAPGPLTGEFVLRRHTIDDTIKEGDGQSIADIDGDGQNNIIVGTGSGGKVYWYEKLSPYNWRRHLIAEGYTEIEGTIAADFNGDGRIEVVIFDQATRNPPGLVDIAKQDTDDPRGSWSTQRLDNAAHHTQQGLVYDVTGDGNPDFVYSIEGRAADDGGFYWMQNLGGDPLDPHNWVKHKIDQVSGAWWIDSNSPRDFSGNGRGGDILVSVREGRNRAHAQGAIIIYHRPDDPVHDPWEKTVIEDNSEYVPLHVVSADFSGNGDPRDIASGGSHDGGKGLYWYEFATRQRHTVDTEGRWWGTYAIDINNSGHAEIISGTRSDNSLRIYSHSEQSGKYELVAQDSFLKPDDKIIFDDITGDGHRTEFFVGSDPDGIFWYQAFEVAWDRSDEIELDEAGRFELHVAGLDPKDAHQFRLLIEDSHGRVHPGRVQTVAAD